MDAMIPKEHVAKRIGEYVRLRDVIKQMDEAHKEKMSKYREALELLGNLLLDYLNKNGLDRISADGAGTVYKTEKKSATIADKSIFWEYVMSSQKFDLLDYKANAVAVAEHITETGQAPPGVNFNALNTVGVRKA